MSGLLVVDDEVFIQNSIRRLFSDDDSIKVFTASGAQEASTILTQHEVDIIISDERMPQVSGTDFLRFVKARYPGIQRILLTAYADKEATMKAINNAEVFRFLIKPWEPADLVATVKHALEIKKLRDDNEKLNREVLEQNQVLEKANASLEAKVSQRTEQLKKSLELLKMQHETLKGQRTGIIDLLISIISLHDAGKSRIAKKISEAWGRFVETKKLTVPEDAIYASMLSVFMGKAGDTFVNLLSTIGGFSEITRVLKQSRENYDGSGPSGTAKEAIPVESRLLRIVHDYFSEQPDRADMARHLLITQSGKHYDPELVGEFLTLFDEERKGMAIHELLIKNLLSGMILAKDLMLVNGALLLSEGTVLTETMIQQLKRAQSILVEPAVVTFGKNDEV